MTQTIIALFIVALALLWVLMRLFKKPSGNCNCGCSTCPTNKRNTCTQAKKKQ